MVNDEFMIREEIAKVELTVVAHDHVVESNGFSVLICKVREGFAVARYSNGATGPLVLDLLQGRVIGVVCNVK
jgi:hypothetical protein